MQKETLGEIMKMIHLRDDLCLYCGSLWHNHALHKESCPFRTALLEYYPEEAKYLRHQGTQYDQER